MKVLIGAGLVALLVAGVSTCPAHIRQQAQDAATIPPEVRAEVSRQLDLFTAAMGGQQPEVQPPESQ